MFNKDFGKSAKDLLTRDFPGKFDIEINSESDNFDLSTEMNLEEDGTFSASVTENFDLSKEIAFEGTLDSDCSHSLKFTNRDYLLKGLKTSVAFDGCQKKEGDSYKCSGKATLTSDYVKSNFTTSLKLAFPSCCSVSPPTSTVGLVYLRNDLAFGAEGVVKPGSDKPLQKVTGNVQYTTSDYTISVGTVFADGGVDGVLRYFRKNKDFNFAAELNWDGDSQAVDGSIGFERALSHGSIGKVILTSSGTVGVSFKKRVCPNATFVVGTKVDFDTLVHSTGVSISYDC